MISHEIYTDHQIRIIVNYISETEILTLIHGNRIIQHVLNLSQV